MNDQRLYNKYQIINRETGTEADGQYFVLKPEKDSAARAALLAYASITNNEELAMDITKWLSDLPDLNVDTLKPAVIDDLGRVMAMIIAVQDPAWDMKCDMKECYWNMHHPQQRPDRSECTSESLADTRMIPNTCQCPLYWSYAEACGLSKGEVSKCE